MAKDPAYFTTQDIYSWIEHTPALGDVLRNTERRAAKKGLAFSLKLDSLVRMYKLQGGRCALTGVPMMGRVLKGSGVWNPYRPSVDRVNNALGYTTGNIRLVTLWANVAMHQWGEEIFDKFLLSRLKTRYPEFVKFCGREMPHVDPLPLLRRLEKMGMFKAGAGI